MEKRNRAALAIACVALLVLIGAGCARCAMVHGGQQDPVEKEQTQEAEAGTQLEVKDSLDKLLGTKWTSEDGKSTLSIVSGAFVESSGGEDAVTYWTAGDAQLDSGGFSESVWVGDGLAAEQRQSVVRVDVAGNGRTSIASDSFKKSKSYLADAAEGAEIAVKGDVSRLAALAGTDEESIKATLRDFAKSKSPYATQASWDGEVYIDANANTTSSTFTLDDPNRTIVTVTVDGATGETSAM